MEVSVPDPDRLFSEFRRSGNPRALGEVYDLLAPELLRVAMHTTRDAAEAEDVLQATFLVAIQEAQRWDPSRRLLPWLVGIMANEALRSRARAARQPDPSRVERPVDELPEDAAQREELLEQLDRAFERIPAAYRPVLQLRLRHGLSLPEIAATLERPPGTVRSQLARGTELLRRSLPAGLAGVLLAFAAPTRGLAAVRAEILSHAAALKVGAGIASFVGGVFAVKKLAVLVAVLLAALWWWQSGSGPAPEAPLLSVAPNASDPALESSAQQGGERAELSSGGRESASPAPAAQLGPAAQREDSAGSTLTVHARWSDGAPAAEEVVILTSGRERRDEAQTQLTDASGTTTFIDLPAGGATVRLLRGQEDYLNLRAGKSQETWLSIKSGVDIEGRVIDASGAAVAGASIWLSERWRNNFGHRIATSDARGEFRVRSIPPDHYVGALARGFAPSNLRPVRGAQDDTVRIEIPLVAVAAPLEVEVVDASGAPIPSAFVLLGNEIPPGVRQDDGSFVPSSPPQRARADANGRASIECAALGFNELQVRARNFAPASTSVNVIAGIANRCRVTLEAHASLTGRVVDSRGAPVSSAWVVVGEADRFAGASTNTSMDGTFELAGLPSGSHLARIEHRQSGSAARTLQLVSGQTAEWRATLVPGPRIEGQILDADGTPRAGLVVVAFPNAQRDRTVRSDASDRDGRFLVSGVEAEPHTLRVQPPGGWREFPLLTLDGVWPDGPPLLLRLEPERGFGRIVLQVEDPDGHPLSGAELQVWHSENRLWQTFVSGGKRGEIEVQNVSPGTVTLELRHSAHPWKRLGEHKLAAGETLDLGRITLERSGSLQVELRGIPEADCSKLFAVITDSTHKESAAARFTPGRLTVNVLAPGKHLLRLGADGILQVQREFEITAGVRTEFILELVAATTREVQFRRPADAPGPKWIALSLLDSKGALVWGGNADCTKDPQTALVTANPGTYRLWAGADGGLGADAEFVVPPMGQVAAPFVVDLVRRP